MLVAGVRRKPPGPEATVARSLPLETMRQASLVFQSAARRASAAACRPTPVTDCTMRMRPVPQLGVGGPDVHHEVAVGLAQPHHDRGRQGVQGDLLGRAGVHAAGTGDDLAAHHKLDGVSAAPAEHAPGIAGHPDGGRSGHPGMNDGAEHERGSAAGRNADDDVLFPTERRSSAACPASGSSSAPSIGMAQGPFPPASTASTIPCGHVERRPELGRVQDGEPAGGAGADVDQPASGGEAPDTMLDGGRLIDGAAATTASVARRESAAISATSSAGAEQVQVIEPGTYRLGREAAESPGARWAGPQRRQTEARQGQSTGRGRAPAGGGAGRGRGAGEGHRQRLGHQPVDLGPHRGLVVEAAVGVDTVGEQDDGVPAAPGATSNDVPVKPVCQMVPDGQVPQSSGSSRQPSPRTSAAVAAWRVLIRATDRPTAARSALGGRSRA